MSPTCQLPAPMIMLLTCLHSTLVLTTFSQSRISVLLRRLALNSRPWKKFASRRVEAQVGDYLKLCATALRLSCYSDVIRARLIAISRPTSASRYSPTPPGLTARRLRLTCFGSICSTVLSNHPLCHNLSYLGMCGIRLPQYSATYHL